MTKKLSTLDLAFLSLEKQTTPVNVASLTIFELPEEHDGNYARDLLHKLESQKAGPPFNMKLSNKKASSRPSWIEDEHFDIHYHVRHSALPHPGTHEDLLELVSRLHSRLLDRERPLWEFYLIEGLEGNRMAMYIKMHHACIDGMGGIAIMENCFSLAPGQEVIAPWVGVKKKRKNHLVEKPQEKSLKQATADLMHQISDGSHLVQDFSKLLFSQSMKAIGLKNATAPAPFTAPKSIFNVPISTARRFAVKALPLSEVKAVGKRAGATVNDMVLAMCSGALRQYMLDIGELPEKSLIATVPVSMPQLHRPGNQITYVMSSLATDEIDSLKRLARIEASTQCAKSEIEDVEPSAATSFAVFAQGFTAALNQLNITNFVPPPANVTISNVPGPRQTLYFGDAKLSAMYPLSVLIDGQALNITVVSYCDAIEFGFLACRDTLPDVSKIADYVADAFEAIKNRIALDEMMKKD